MKFNTDFDPVEFFANAGGFYVEERSSDADSALFGIQAGLKYDIESYDAYLLGGAGYFYFTHTKGYNCFYDSENSFGNSAIPESAGSSDLVYLDEYHLLEAFAELGLTLADTPVLLYADFVKNNGAENGEDTGWLVGFKINKCKAPGSWELGYNYRNLEKDAVIGAFTDADFVGGGTDGKGHKICAGYQISKGWKAAASYFISEQGLDDHDDRNYRRLQLDLNYKF